MKQGATRFIDSGRNASKNLSMTRAIRLTTKPDTIKDRHLPKPGKRQGR